MKKFLSIILALVTMFCIGTTAFAHENVDNTFDNFTPGPGVQAPDNWYDPYCYDTDGTILAYIFPYENCTYYCTKHQKLYTNAIQKIEGEDRYYKPYETLINHPDYKKGEYCPYCGDIKFPNSSFAGHTAINEVYYGTHCNNCGAFPVNRLDGRNLSCNTCTNCFNTIKTDNYYRFIPKSYETAEFTHIFNESEHKFGNGKDGYVEDLKTNSFGYFVDWDNPANNDTNLEVPNTPNNSEEEPVELTFWQKIANFFTNIGIWFANIFTF